MRSISPLALLSLFVAASSAFAAPASLQPPTALSAKKAEQNAFAAVKSKDYCAAGNFFFAAHLARSPGKAGAVLDVDSQTYLDNAVQAFERAGDFARAGAILKAGFSPRPNRNLIQSEVDRAKSQRHICEAPTPDQRGQLTLMQHLELRQSLTEHIQQTLFKPNPARGGSDDQLAAYNIQIGNSAILGPKKAPHTLFVFSDFQCPFCARIQPLLAEVLRDKSLKGKINIVAKEFPLGFHKNARPAAKAALAAGNQGDLFYYKMSEKLYAHQKELTAENFSVWAKQIGLDVKRFEKDLRDRNGKLERLIDDDQRMATRVAKVRGTPSIYVDGWQLKERTVDGIKALIAKSNASHSKKSSAFQRVLTR